MVEPACQCRRHETQVRFLGQEDPLEDSMATHSSILAWRIPWTERPGGLQSMESQSQTWQEQLSTHPHTNFLSFLLQLEPCRRKGISLPLILWKCPYKLSREWMNTNLIRTSLLFNCESYWILLILRLQLNCLSISLHQIHLHFALGRWQMLNTNFSSFPRSFILTFWQVPIPFNMIRVSGIHPCL